MNYLKDADETGKNQHFLSTVKVWNSLQVSDKHRSHLIKQQQAKNLCTLTIY